jgi:hypothetical protein
VFLSKKKTLFKCIVLIIFSLSRLIIPLSIDSISDTSKISINILDHKIGWCGGTVNESGIINYWDVFYSIFSFTLGVVNFDTTSHMLEQVIITKTGYYITNGSQFKIKESISANGELPITLLPHRYWSWNFTCESCTYKIALQLKVDSALIDFGVITSDGFQTKWLTPWTKVHYYTESITTSPLSSSVVLIAITGLVIFHRMRKKQHTNRSDFIA